MARDEQGDRGELIVANITIDTLDGLAFKDRGLSSFVVETISYFEALFARNLYKDNIRMKCHRDYAMIASIKPWRDI